MRVQIPSWKLAFFLGGGMGRCSVAYMRHRPCKTAESIELPFGMVSGVGPRTRLFHWRAQWRHLAHTAEQLCAAATSGPASMHGDTACSQITLGNLLKISRVEKDSDRPIFLNGPINKATVDSSLRPRCAYHNERG